MTYCGVYIIQSKCKPKRLYVGHSRDIIGRWRLHKKLLSNNKHHSPQLQRHCNKYGIDDLEFKVVCECDRASLLGVEQFYIDAYKPYFNCAPIAGTTAGYKFTEEQKEKLRGRIPWNKGLPMTEDVREKVRKATTGVKRSEKYKEECRRRRTGWRLSDETKKRISESHFGIKNSPEAVEKIRKANLGRKNPHNEEWNKKISESKKGFKYSDESKLRMSLAKKGKTPWNKGKKTGHEPWNKGKKGLQVNYRKGKKKINGEYVYVD